MDSHQKFEEERLPSIDSFDCTLTGSGISDEEYRHAQIVWNYLNLKNMGEYHDLYVKCDVFQLADVFEKYASIIMALIVCTLHGTRTCMAKQFENDRSATRIIYGYKQAHVC
ncbi:hypothetical protein AVEN_264846-1 [Araneus ventricosus]|uniref:Uncharacterized protein n=1 Tax=Araneus ventricosus TaxID=182803 RepID=A0A4Y2L1U2_ARAVE|nr:hypothetical protein AVEN_264846-1 [Araneus ventricosus]